MSGLEQDQQRAIGLIGVGLALGAVGLGAAILTAVLWFYLCSDLQLKQEPLPGMHVRFDISTGLNTILTTRAELFSSNVSPPMATFVVDHRALSIHDDSSSTASNHHSRFTTPTITGLATASTSSHPQSLTKGNRWGFTKGELEKMHFEIVTLHHGQTAPNEDLPELLQSENGPNYQEKVSQTNPIAALMDRIASMEVLLRANDEKHRIETKRLESALNHKLEAQSINTKCIVEKSLHEFKQDILPRVGNFETKFKDFKASINIDEDSSFSDLIGHIKEIHNVTHDHVATHAEGYKAFTDQINTNHMALENAATEHDRQLKQIANSNKDPEIDETRLNSLISSVAKLECKIDNLVDSNSVDAALVTMKNFIEEWDPVLPTLICRNDLKAGMKNVLLAATNKVGKEIDSVWREISTITAYAKEKLAAIEPYDFYFQVLQQHQLKLKNDTAALDRALANNIAQVNDLEARFTRLECGGPFSGQRRPINAHGFYSATTGAQHSQRTTFSPWNTQGAHTQGSPQHMPYNKQHPCSAKPFDSRQSSVNGFNHREECSVDPRYGFGSRCAKKQNFTSPCSPTEKPVGMGRPQDPIGQGRPRPHGMNEEGLYGC
jgi:hypothetical protein